MLIKYVIFVTLNKTKLYPTRDLNHLRFRSYYDKMTIYTYMRSCISVGTCKCIV